MDAQITYEYEKDRATGKKVYWPIVLGRKLEMLPQTNATEALNVGAAVKSEVIRQMQEERQAAEAEAEVVQASVDDAVLATVFGKTE